MPSAYGSGLGSPGFAAGAGGAFNYGGGASGFGAGNAFGNTMTSAIGGVGHAFGSGMGLAGGIGGAYMGFRSGGVGGMIGGGMLGFGVGSLVGAGVKHVAGSFMEGAHEQASIERTLSQFQFQNGASRSGKGFSRQDSMQIGNMVRQMERMPEMFTSFGELNRVMDKMGSMGLMQGVRDAGEFQKKFRDTVGTLQTMAKVIGTSMEGALKVFGEARMSGFYSKADILRNTINSQVTSSLTGMSAGQVSALQRYGGEMGHATGGSRRTGAIHIQRSAAQLGMANQMGVLSNDQILEMTGKEGAEGIQDLAVSMTQLGYKMSRSNVGQALTLALGEKVDGRYTGKMDQELVEKVRRGELSLGELKRMARSKANTRGAKLSFAAHKERLRSEMAGSVGAEGMAMQLQEILGNRGWRNPDATNLVMQRFGASEEQANLLQQLMPNLQNIGTSMGAQGNREAQNMGKQAALRERGWDAMKHRLSTKLKHVTTDWAKDLGVSVRDYFQNWADSFVDDLTGQYREYVTKRVGDTAKFAAAGGVTAQANLAAMTKRANAFTSNLGAAKLYAGSSGGFSGFLAGAAHSFDKTFLGGEEHAGERAQRFLRGIDGGKFLTRSTGKAGEAQLTGGGVLDPISSFAANSLTESNRNAAIARMTQLQSDEGGLAALKDLKDSGLAEGNLLQTAFSKAMQSGAIQMEEDQGKRSDMIWKKMKAELKSQGHHDLVKDLESKGKETVIAAVQADARKKGYRGAADLQRAAQGILGGLDLRNQSAVGKKLEEIDRSLSKTWKGTDKVMSWKEVKGLMDSDDPLAKLLLGNEKAGGIASKGGFDKDASARRRKGATSEEASGDRIRDILSRTEWDESDRTFLRDVMGVDPEQLAKRINTPEGQKEIAKLLNTKDAAGFMSEKLKVYQIATEASGLNKIAGDMKSSGRELAGRLTSMSDEKKKLTGAKGGDEVLGMISNRAKALSEYGDKGQYKETAGEIASKIAGLDKSAQQSALALAGDDVRMAYSTITSGAKEFGKKDFKKGLGVDEVLKRLGVDLGSGSEATAFKKELAGKLGDDKKLSSKDELMKILGSLGNVSALSSKTGAGITGASTQVSEADVAKALSEMSANNLAASQILANLAAGKTGSAATEGVTKPGGK